VFLVDDNQPQIHQRCKYGGAGADDDAGLAAADSVPLLGAFVGGETGVEERDLGAEGGEHFACHGGGEADFGDEQQGGLAGAERALHGGEVDAGFAGAGDAVEQNRLESALGHGGGDGGECFHLGFVERMLVGALFAVGGKAAEVEVFGRVFDDDQVALD
jgi:hypothetical protein